MHKLAISTIAMTLSATAVAGDFKPTIIFDMGGKFDKSFNQSAYKGMEKFKKDTGIAYREFEVSSDAQRVQAMRKMAKRGGNPIVTPGWAQQTAVKTVATEYPNTKFTIVDSVVDLPNVRSVIFKEQEGSFLVGILAAMKTKTGTISFVGGMDIPLIRAFACGYEQGAKYVKSDIKIIENMTGTDGTAWNNPGRGAELAKSQFEKGSDIVFAAAGGTGLGVYQAAKDAGKYAIGVDSNQNYIHPGTMLTSMLKRVDVAMYKALDDAHKGKFTGGLHNIGIKEGAVGWAYDKYNKDLITAKMKETVEQARKDIISGKINVVDYRTNNKCAY